MVKAGRAKNYWKTGAILQRVSEQKHDKKGCNRQKTIRVSEESKPNEGRRPSGVIQRTPKIPWWHPPDYDILQSGRVLELQNRDLWLRPTDMSWHLPTLMTIREEPFKNYRSRTSEKWKAKEDKIEEAKKQNI